MKKTQLTAIILLSIGASNLVFAGGKTGACTPPEGEIDIQPSQKCGGTYTVAIGKDLTLTANGLKDKDCYCGSGVQDSINTTSGVKWSVGGGMGTFTGGDTGTPKTWTAPATTHTSLAVRLQVDDEATASHTFDDGGFTEVTSLNLDVVIPNKVTFSVTNGSCGSGLVGHEKFISDTVNRNQCTVDFQGLDIYELQGFTVISDGCSIYANHSTGTDPATIGSGNVAAKIYGGAGNDVHYICYPASVVYPSNCDSSNTCQWVIQASGGSSINMFTRKYTYKGKAGGGHAGDMTLSQSIVSYP